MTSRRRERKFARWARDLSRDQWHRGVDIPNELEDAEMAWYSALSEARRRDFYARLNLGLPAQRWGDDESAS